MEGAVWNYEKNEIRGKSGIIFENIKCKEVFFYFQDYLSVLRENNIFEGIIYVKS